MAPQSYLRPPLRSESWCGQDGFMSGAIIIIIVLVVAIPVTVLISGGIASALLGYFLKEEVDTAHAGSELIDTNV
jgi:hypothetical protein